MAQETGVAEAAWSEIRNGDECRVFRVDSEVGSLVVRVHPSRHRAQRIRWTHVLAAHCRASVPEVVAPLRFASGDTVAMLGESSVAVFPWVHGDDLDAGEPALRRQAAHVLGALHRASARFSELAPAGDPLQVHAGVKLPGLLQDSPLQAWERSLPERGLLRLPIHGDFYPRNLLATSERITGVLDWDEACVDYRMAELAWTVWELCKAPRGDDLCRQRAEEFIRDYAAIAPKCEGAELEQLVPFIRRRMRREIIYQFAVIERGGPWNDDNQAYLDAEIRAFETLGARAGALARTAHGAGGDRSVRRS